MPAYVTFSWPKEQTISAVRVVSGWYDGRRTTDAIRDFKLQYRDGDEWKDVEGLQVKNNARVDAVKKFAAIRADKVRLAITRSSGDICRIWEVEFYNPEEKSKIKNQK